MTRALARALVAAVALASSPAVPAQPPTPAKPVTVRSVAALAQIVERSAPATVVSQQDSLLAAQITARVQSWQVQVGDRAAAGAPVLQLECDDHQLALRAAEAEWKAASARLHLARLQLERTQALLQKKHVSPELLDQHQAQLAIAEAEQAARQAGRDSAALQAQRCQVQAPFSGVVTERLADPGELVTPGTPLLRLVDTTQLELSAQLAIEDAASVAQAGRWRFQSAGGEWPLKLRVLLPVVEPRARHQEARFTLATDGPLPLPGSTGRLLWQDAKPHLPPFLLQKRDGVPGLFIVEEGRARFLALPGAIEGQPLAVDLPPDTLVVVHGREGLQASDALKIQP